MKNTIKLSPFEGDVLVNSLYFSHFKNAMNVLTHIIASVCSERKNNHYRDNEKIEFNRALEEIAYSIESYSNSSTETGVDRIRAVIGTSQIAEKFAAFLKAAGYEVHDVVTVVVPSVCFYDERQENFKYGTPLYGILHRCGIVVVIS